MFGHMSHTLIVTIPITYFIFKAILQGLVNLTKTGNVSRNASQPSLSGVSQVVTFVVTLMTNTTTTQGGAISVPAITSLASTPLLTSTVRVPP